MFDDDAGRCFELTHAFPCGVGIDEVVVAESLALELLEGGQRPGLRMYIAVERTCLMRIFP